MPVQIHSTPFDDELNKIRYALHELTFKRKGVRGRIHDIIQMVNDFRDWGYKHLEMKEPDRLYLIWSEEHQGWWRAEKNGYTRWLKEAGRYTLKEASKIEADANRHLEINQYHEVIIRDPFPL